MAYFLMCVFIFLTFRLNFSAGISDMTQKQLDLLILVLYCGVIYWLSDQSKLPSPHLFENEDKLQHLIAYAVMGVFAWRAIAHLSMSREMIFLFSFGFCSLYGIFDEWHQSFVIGRTSSAMDWFADSIGGFLITFSYYCFSRKANKTSY